MINSSKIASVNIDKLFFEPTIDRVSDSDDLDTMKDEIKNVDKDIETLSNQQVDLHNALEEVSQLLKEYDFYRDDLVDAIEDLESVVEIAVDIQKNMSEEEAVEAFLREYRSNI